MKTETQEQDMQFGNGVRARRSQLGVTLDQLAESSGVSAAALSRVERGLLSPTLRNAIAIARGLGCELAELVERDAATKSPELSVWHWRGQPLTSNFYPT